MISSVALLKSTANAEVHQLTQENFAKFIEENDNTLVKFYAPWCGHCKKMAPDYISASDKADVEGKVKFAEVDVTEENELGSEFEIRGFPTLKYFSKGEVFDYEGGRSEQDLLNYVELMTTDPVVSVSSVDEAKKLKKGSNVAIVAQVRADSPNKEKFQTIAMSNRLMGQFFLVEVAADASESVLVVRSDGEKELDFSAPEDLVKTIKTEKLPLFGRVSGENFGDYMETGLDMIWFAGNQSQKDKVHSEVEAAAKEFRGMFNFVFIDSKEFAKQIEGMLGISEADLPQMVRTLDGPGKYMYNGDMTNEGITQWIRDQKDGKIQPTFKSEDVPETNDGAIKLAVGKNFEEIVAEEKDVLLMIHAPWCGVCKKVMPDFEAAAEEVQKKSPDTVMAILDGTANELSNTDYSWNRFPTIYFKKAGSTKPIPYAGERDANGILDYLSKAVKVPFEYEKVATETEENTHDEL